MPIHEFAVEERGIGRKDYSMMIEFSTEPAVRSYQQGFNHYETVTVPPMYTTGFATFVEGSTQVVGLGTNWTAAMVGRRIKNGGEIEETWFTIASVEDATHLTLTEAYYIALFAITDLPVIYEIGGKVVNVALSLDYVAILHDFYASRPNNKLIRMQVETIDAAGAVGLIVDETGYATAEAHLSVGNLFLDTVRFTIFNYDIAEEPYMKIGCNGFYTTRKEYYMEISGG